MSSRASLRLLQVVLGVVLFAYSAQLVMSQLQAPHHSHLIFLLLLGVAEAVAAIIFLVAVRPGGIALLVVIAAAIIFHALHHQLSGVGTLTVYAASVFAVMTNRTA